MDDARTDEALDNLAELFLTGVDTADCDAEPGQVRHRDGRDGHDRPERPDRPGELLHGPASIRLRPQPAGGGAYVAASGSPQAPRESRRPASPHLKLHAPSADAARHPQAGVEPFATDRAARHPHRDLLDPENYSLAVEAVVLGNLPGLSGPWLTQYAQLLAQRDGPVVILHVQDERIDAELVEPTNGRAAPGERIASRVPPPSGDEGADLVELLASLAGHEPRPVRTVLVHLDPQRQDSDMPRALHLDRWTLLSGADDAAVAAAGNLLSELVGSAVEAQAKRVGLMIVGSNREHSLRAAERIRVAVEDDFEQPVELAGWQQQMVPVNLCQCGSFGEVETLWPRLADWLSRAAGEADVPPQPAEPAGAVQAAKPQAGESTREPEPAPAPAHAASSDEPDLAQFLTNSQGPLPGSVVLEARCPRQPKTQLLLDQQGVLHLLRRHDSQQANGGAALKEAIVDLIDARTWVREHLDVLRLTQRQCQFDVDAEAVLHLFTDRADLAVGLVARLGPTLRLHLLQSVQVGDQQTWYSTPLN